MDDTWNGVTGESECDRVGRQTDMPFPSILLSTRVSFHTVGIK